MKKETAICRRDVLKVTTGGALAAGAIAGGVASLSASGASGTEKAGTAAAGPEREVVAGIKTRRLIPGEPYDLAGNRMVFTNWYYVRPGDLDWVDETGKSVYVDGDEDVWAARFQGVDTPRGIRLTTNKPELGEPFEKPVHRGIIQQGGTMIGWSNNACYESENDGYDWTLKGHCKVDEKFHDGVKSVFVDQSAPPEERFKMCTPSPISVEEFEDFCKKRPDEFDPRGLTFYGKGEVHGIRGATSPDGLVWTLTPDPMAIGFYDTTIGAYYDPVLRKYVMYTRLNQAGPRSDQVEPDIRHCWSGVARRSIGRTESPEFGHFPAPELMLEPSIDMLPSETLYTNGYTSIPGAPDHHLLFPVVWNASLNDNTRVVMAASHDGKVWHWVPGTLLETQPFGHWAGGAIWVSGNLLEMKNGDWALQCSGHNVPHKYPRGQRLGAGGYATWPKGRLMGIEAVDRGQFTTVAFMPPKGSRTLKINAVTRRTGGIRVEANRWGWSEGKRPYPYQLTPLPGRTLAESTPIIGDQHWTTVTWKNGSNLGYHEGEPLVLRFELDQATIYGLEFV